MKAFAGIGSRKMPSSVIPRIGILCEALATLGWVLRSGGAEGADAAFEGCWTGSKEIYLPWRGFNRSASTLYPPSADAYEEAEQHHPAWSRLQRGPRALHARNAHQVLGLRLDDPVRMVVCWTERGAGGGGTGQALRMARYYGIPVYDLFFGDSLGNAIAFANSLPSSELD